MLSGWDVELAPQGINVCLRVVEASKLHKMVASGRVCTICANHEIKGHFDLRKAVHGV